MMRRLSRSLLPFILLPLICVAAEVRIEGRFAPPRAETPLALPSGEHQAVVASDGGTQ